MNVSLTRWDVVKVSAVVFLFILMCVAVAPRPANAQASNADAVADAMCNPVITQCGCGQVMVNGQCQGGSNMWMCPCQGPHASGMCDAPNHCKATSYNAQSGQKGGSPDSGLDKLAQALGSLLSALKPPPSSPSSPPPSSGGGGSSPTSSTGTCTTGYYQTSDTSEIGVDPCAEYSPSAASSISTTGTGNTPESADQLLQSLTGTGTATPAATPSLSASPTSGPPPLIVTFSTNAIDSTQSYSINFGDGSSPQPLTSGGCNSGSFAACTYGINYTYNTLGTFTANLLDAGGNTLASVTVTVSNASGSSGALQQAQPLLAGTSSQGFLQQLFSNSAGVAGNIFFTNTGATIVAQLINQKNNSTVSGFYGSDTASGGSQSVVANLCQARPWASNFLADVIPPSFFDGLCQWQGFQVGTPPPATAPQVTLQQGPASTPPATTPTAPVPTGAPVVQIWAVPATVPLGSRTSIFWNTQGVASCTETSPDGSFSESTLSGAAATVPLTGATTYTISCQNATSTPITSYVTVTLSI